MKAWIVAHPAISAAVFFVGFVVLQGLRMGSVMFTTDGLVIGLMLPFLFAVFFYIVLRNQH